MQMNHVAFARSPALRVSLKRGIARLSFHWKAILLPPRIAQYVVIHELAHGLHPDHSAAFWIKVEQHLPDWRGRKSWLADNGIQVEGI